MKRHINQEHYVQIQNKYIERGWTFSFEIMEEAYAGRSWYTNEPIIVFNTDTAQNRISFETFLQNNSNALLPCSLNECSEFLSRRARRQIPPPGIDDVKKETYILLNEAGSGKTTYLTWLAHKLFREPYTRWIIKLKLIECSFVFSQYRQGETIDETAALKLLFSFMYMAFLAPNINSAQLEYAEKAYQNAQQCAEALKMSNGCVELDAKKIESMMNVNYKSPTTCRMLVLLRIFRLKFRNKLLYLLLDGFDEIAPTYKETALALLSEIDGFEGICKLYLTSRPYGFRKDFEQVVKACSFYRLEKFRDDDIFYYTSRFVSDKWKNSSKANGIGLVGVLFVLVREFVGAMGEIPLFLSIGLQLLQNVMEKHVDFAAGLISRGIMQACETRFEPMRMMETFVAKTLDINNLDKTNASVGTIATPVAIMMREAAYEKILRMHTIQAMYHLFENETIETLLPEKMREKALKYMGKIQNGSEKSGIIEGVVSNKPLFVHRLFAEYFAALWLFSNKDLKGVKKFVKRLMYGKNVYDTIEVRRFLNRLVCRDSPIHMAILDRSNGKIEELLRTNKDCINVKDCWGRTPLHLAFGEWWVLQDFFDNMAFWMLKLLEETNDVTKIDATDDYFGWSVLYYALAGFSISLHGKLKRLDIIFEHLNSEDPIEIFYYAMKLAKQWEPWLTYNDSPTNGVLQPLLKCIARKLIDGRRFDLHSPIRMKEDSTWNEHYSKFSEIQKRYSYVRTPFDYCVYFDSRLLESLVDAAGGPEKVLSRVATRLLGVACEHRLPVALWYLIIHCKFQLPSIRHYKQVITFLWVYMLGDRKMFRDLFHKYCKQYNIACLDDDQLHEPEMFDEKRHTTSTSFRSLRLLKEGEFPNEKQVLENGIDAGTYVLLKIALTTGNAMIFKQLILKTGIAIDTKFIADILSELELRDEKWCCSFHILLEMSEKLHGELENGQNLLHIACTKGWFDLVWCLMEHFSFDALHENERENNWNAFFYFVQNYEDDDDDNYEDDDDEDDDDEDDLESNMFFDCLMETCDMDCFGKLDAKGKSVFKYALEGDVQIACSIMYREFRVRAAKSIPERSACLLQRLQEAKVTKQYFCERVEKLTRWAKKFDRYIVDVQHMQEILLYETP